MHPSRLIVSIPVILGLMVFPAAAARGADSALPPEEGPPALEFPHFPTRAHAFIWRNWPLVDAERLAETLGADEAAVREAALSMGLPEQSPIPESQFKRISITVIRRNWHLLPYDQLLTLLDFSEAELAYSLREDDFLWIKLGSHKPQCGPLRLEPPDAAAIKRCAEIRALMERELGGLDSIEGEPRLAFLDEFNRPTDPPERRQPPGAFSPQYLYSYFALYGDPLMNPELDPFPEEYLRQLAELGVDGVWMHAVLRHLAPGGIFPEFGEGHEQRLAALRKLTEKTRRFGIGVYLYMNEPRAMPAAFFEGREEFRGAEEAGYYAICTSVPATRQWLSDSLAHVFREVPGLAGAFTITASENFTHCASHGRQAQCPRCRERGAAEIVAEVNAAIEEGAHRGNPDARVIAWDWGWRDEWAAEAIALLPPSMHFMSVSEWSKPIERGGIETRVGEYSISAAGPGPRAAKHWALARERGLKTLAKMQINNSWELSAVPYLPVLNLVARHGRELLSAGVDGVMMGWTLGGHPSPNLEFYQLLEQSPEASNEALLRQLAERWFGPDGAERAMEAWRIFSEAFLEYPFHIGVAYRAPQQFGPSNPLYLEPTGYGATMIGFPYDDLDGWRGPYPPDVFENQFRKMAERWSGGLAPLREAAESAPPALRENAEDQLRFAEAAQLHFASVANQARFVMLRDRLREAGAGETAGTLRDGMIEVARDEMRIAKRLREICAADSRIGFEASNHYYYIPDDLAEKILNADWIVRRLTSE